MGRLLITAFFSSTLILLMLIVFLLYLYLKYVVFDVWKQKGIPHDKLSTILGNVLWSFFKGQSIYGAIIKETYEKFKKSRLYGLYILFEPLLVITDPEIIRHVLVKNCAQFHNHDKLADGQKHILPVNLSTMNDEKWKIQGPKISPDLTSDKLQLKYHLIEEICHKLISAVETNLIECDVIEIKEFSVKYAVDCISLIVYGSNADCLNNPDSMFYKCGKLQYCAGKFYILLSQFISRLIKFMPLTKKRKLIEKFFIDLFFNMIELQRKGNISKNDILNMIMKLVYRGKIGKESQSVEFENSTIIDTVGESLKFFSVDLDTTASLITCCVYELAVNPDIQQRLFYEVYEVNSNVGGITYEKIFKMPYLDMVLQESLRKYPAITFLARICTEDFEVADSNLRIKKGTRIAIPIVGLHMDHDIFPDPEKFDPTRFTSENKLKRHNFTYLPFGDEPRPCIAKRLAILQSKMALFYLLLNYKFSPCEKTPRNITLLPDHTAKVPCDLPLRIDKRQ